jgi:DnaK suppressor protein
MTNAEIKKYRDILEAKQAELTYLLRNREGIEIEKSPDALDEVQRASEREFAMRNVRAALQRIEHDQFGICMHCEEDISVKRLNAVPWTPYCIECQEQYDRKQFVQDEMFDDMLVSA